MLECKFSCWKGVKLSNPELIDTCWNVNYESYSRQKTLLRELIDTCWNVNNATLVVTGYSGLELIDTCWNVNTASTSAKSEISPN